MPNSLFAWLIWAIPVLLTIYQILKPRIDPFFAKYSERRKLKLDEQEKKTNAKANLLMTNALEREYFYAQSNRTTIRFSIVAFTVFLVMSVGMLLMFSSDVFAATKSVQDYSTLLSLHGTDMSRFWTGLVLYVVAIGSSAGVIKLGREMTEQGKLYERLRKCMDEKLTKQVHR